MWQSRLFACRRMAHMPSHEEHRSLSAGDRLGQLLDLGRRGFVTKSTTGAAGQHTSNQLFGDPGGLQLERDARNGRVHIVGS
jgi:hypothetical protein